MVLEKFIEGITNQDLALLESLLHEDMLFVQETTLETKEEWMRDTKEQFKNGMLDATKMEVTKKFETKISKAISKAKIQIAAKYNMTPELIDLILKKSIN